MKSRILLAALAISMVAVPTGGQNWTQRTPVTSPPARNTHAMAYDAARHRVVLFGGMGVYPALNDTWEWDGSKWTQRWPQTSPLARTDHAMVYDAARQRVVLFGGRRGLSALNDTWEWDGTTWTQRTPAKSPPARANHAMAYDAARRRVVLFGGNVGQFKSTWEWDGNTWTHRVPVTIPPGRTYHAMAYDAARKRVVLFGGFDIQLSALNDTWEWDGSTWTQRMPVVRPPARGGHAVVYDVVRKCAVLFGGNWKSLMYNDTWEWRGITWTQRFPKASPSARTVHAMAYDVARRRVMLFGGGVGNLNDTWEYAGTLLLANGTARPGGSVSLALTAPGDEGKPFQVGSSLGTGPIPVDTRQIDLSPDNLLAVSVTGLWPWIFSGYRGIIGTNGQAKAAINIPNFPVLIGLRLHTAFVTLSPSAPSGIRSISNTFSFSITK